MIDFCFSFVLQRDSGTIVVPLQLVRKMAIAASDMAHKIAQDLSDSAPSEVLAHVAELIDGGFDARMPDATTRAFDLLDRFADLQPAPSPADIALSYYFRANAWENRLYENGRVGTWHWEQEEIRQQILDLRRALRHPGFAALPAFRRCQILTNLGNALNTVGRFIEAVEYWDLAILIEPRFAKALGNRALGLLTYANHLYDNGHCGHFYVEAHESVCRAVSDNAIFDSYDGGTAKSSLRALRDSIPARIDLEAVRSTINWDDHSLGRSASERAYRTWCLEQRLFINPLCDLRAKPLAAADVLTLPSVRTNIASAAPPPIIGFFNQMKQEYVSARYFLFEGLHAQGGHFSDKEVLLYNTLDYPAYGLGSERIRTAFRTAYSIFDKVGFFLNEYLSIGIPAKNVSFRSLWYEAKGKEPKPLLARFEQHANLPLRGLFWLSKEFKDEDFQAVTDPDADALADIRNHLEHKYLQLHDDDIAVSPPSPSPIMFSMQRSEFAAKTLRLLKYARSSLIYLSLAVHREEALRSKGSQGLVAQMPLTHWDDEWKR